MIRLTNATTDILACTPSSTNVLKTMVSYTDVTASSWTGNSEPHSLAAASKATLCGTPGASTVREIDHVTISASGGANTVTVLQTISATDYQLISVALSSGDTLEYTHAAGWRVLDSSGTIKMTIGGAVAATTLSASTASPAGLTQEAWTAPTLLNSWVNYGSIYQTAGYFKDSEGVVHIRGVIKSGTTTAGTTVFVLPVGYRPSAYEIYPVDGNGTFVSMLIDTSGNVSWNSTANATATSISAQFRAA